MVQARNDSDDDEDSEDGVGDGDGGEFDKVLFFVRERIPSIWQKVIVIFLLIHLLFVFFLYFLFNYHNCHRGIDRNLKSVCGEFTGNAVVQKRVCTRQACC